MSRSSDFRILLLTAPSHPETVACIRLSYPVTAAGPRRDFTVFPIKALGPLKESLYYDHNKPASRSFRSNGSKDSGLWTTEHWKVYRLASSQVLFIGYKFQILFNSGVLNSCGTAEVHITVISVVKLLIPLGRESIEEIQIAVLSPGWITGRRKDEGTNTL